jgi:putative RNA 2'-phosphotransferase
MDDKRLSKFLSLVLRHEPEAAGLALDAQGRVEIDDLARATMKRFGAGERDIERVVRDSDKQRFIIQGSRIRANQGHSVSVDLGLEPSEPPAQLWHGTTAGHLESILASGLEKRGRQHVHLSIDQETARRVATRRTGPWVILRVDAAAMRGECGAFYVSENGVWLTDAVPARFLSVAEQFSHRDSPRSG